MRKILVLLFSCPYLSMRQQKHNKKNIKHLFQKILNMFMCEAHTPLSTRNSTGGRFVSTISSIDVERTKGFGVRLIRKAATLFVMLLMMLMCGTVAAQDKSRYNPGDIITPALLAQVRQIAGNDTAKLYIIGFFSTNCNTSLTLLLQPTALQEQFGGNVALVPVTRQHKEVVQHELHRRKAVQYYHAVYSHSDSVWGAHFFYNTVPHLVWIDAKGKVLAITSGEQLTTAHIQQVLMGRTMILPVKKDRDYDHSKTLLYNLGLQQPAMNGYSFYCNELEGITAAKFRMKDTVQHRTRITVTNSDVAGLYALAYNKRFLKPYQFVVDSTISRDAYCYELLLNSTSDSVIQHAMLQDLGRYFNTAGRMEQREVQYLKLDPIPTPRPPEGGVKGKTPEGGVTASELLKVLMKQGLPYIDNAATGMRLPKKVVDAIAQAGNKISILMMNQLLQPYGLAIVTASTVTDVLVITPNNNHH